MQMARTISERPSLAMNQGPDQVVVGSHLMNQVMTLIKII